jgi:tetratricopeptide (TPR) repeat protein
LLNPGKSITSGLSLAALLVLTGCSTVGGFHGGNVMSSPQYSKARTLMEDGRYSQSIPLLKQMLAAKPEQPDLSVNLAIAYRETGQPDEAANILQSVLEKHPNHTAALNQFGIVERQLGHFDKALSAYQHAISVDDDYALAHRNLGILYDIYLQKTDDALKQYEKYLALSDNGDKEVENWIIDLKRRIGAAQNEDKP